MIDWLKMDQSDPAGRFAVTHLTNIKVYIQHLKDQYRNPQDRT